MANLTITRREALLGAAGITLAGAVARVLGAAPAAAASGPPVARIEPVTDEYFGERITDPYRWMENPKDPQFEAFMRGQAAWARSLLDAIPARQKLYDRITELSGATVITTSMQSCGGRLFFQQRPQGADNYKLFVRRSAGAPAELLIDPTQMKQEGSHISLDWWLASPDGHYVVYGLSAAGSEDSVAHVMHVDTREVLPERISRTQYASPSWLPDGSGFFYNRLAGSDKGSTDYYKDSVAWLHRLRSDPEQDLRVLARGQYAQIPVEPTDFPAVIADPSSPYVLAGLIGGVRRENPFYVARLTEVIAGRPEWRSLCSIADEVVGITFRDDEVYLQTTKGAQNARVLRTSLSAGSFEKASVVVPESDVVIDNISLARDGLYIQDMSGGYGNLRRLANDGQLSPIPTPFEGSIQLLATNTGEAGLYWIGTSWLVPLTVLSFDPKTGKHTDTGISPKPSIDLTPYEAIRTHALARDGTQVPLSIIARKGLTRDGRAAALVDAYGSYQIVNAPFFNARGFAFLELGGVLATAHVRGGGEYGRRWWKAGQKLNKPNTWRDLIDCCESMIHAGWTSAARLAIQGGSAGGITVGMALTERPDLFAAVIDNVGVSNALRAEFSPNGPPNIAEFGTVKERDGFQGLKEMDALHHVRDGVKYPAVLLTTGLQDPRVEPWQVAKMTARLQKASAAPNPVILRVDLDAGHGLGSTRSQTDAERTDEYAFVLWRAGVAGFQPPAA
jgi:prolyl oligopeptidase